MYKQSEVSLPESKIFQTMVFILMEVTVSKDRFICDNKIEIRGTLR